MGSMCSGRGGGRRSTSFAILAVAAGLTALATVVWAHGSGGDAAKNIGSPSATKEGTITVNGVPLSSADVRALELRYRTRLLSGAFWYDGLSGLWGMWGGPALGQIDPGLTLGGPLPPDASGGGSGVFINGREIHAVELEVLRRAFGAVLPGRYWLDHRGVGGFEGGPAAFQLSPARYGDDGQEFLRRTPGGTLAGDAACSYYSHPDGPSVMVGAGCD